MAATPYRLTSEFGDIWVEVDPRTGGPIRIGTTKGDAIPVSANVRLLDGGTERRGPDGGLVYDDTTEVTIEGVAGVPLRSTVSLTSRVHEIDVQSAQPERWGFTWRYEFNGSSTPLAISLCCRAVSDAAIMRNLHLDLDVAVTGDGWRVQSPGNSVRCDLPLSELSNRLAVLPMSGVDGSVGLLALEQLKPARTALLWPAAQAQIGDTYVAPTDRGIALTWQTDLGGQPGAGGTLIAGPLLIDIIDEPYRSVLPTVPKRLAELGITSPNDPPEWIRGANIYEVPIGYAPFSDGWTYAPYPDASDLLADLDRIEDFGYNVLQIMPRQPYPGYAVHDYDDISIAWGDEDTLRQIVDECHRRGMRVILDILMHGVIDIEVMDEAIAGVRNGPFADRLEGEMPDITTLDADEADGVLLTWSRHIIDQGEYWKAGSPQRHALVDEHPEWFCRDSSGHITSRYTRAFDTAHPEWQEFFIEKALDIVRRLDIDGYRFDAPSYNYFMNWAPRTRANAAVSMLGCLPMFDELRTRMRQLKPDALLYTEPSGVLWRKAMDLTYNYDELFLMRAVLEPDDTKTQWVRNGAELARWLSDRDATLPHGSMTAHCIDSHDSFWWPSPGKKWRREQYGIEATRAMLALFALSGEPYMTFVGGEVGMEDFVKAIHRLRRDHGEFTVGRSDYDVITADDERVYAVVRRGEHGTSAVVVNVSNAAVRTGVRLDREVAPRTETSDLLAGDTIVWTESQGGSVANMSLAPFQALAVRLTP